MIVSTTLAGPGCEAIIGDAIKSVMRLVYHIIIIDSGVNWDKVNYVEGAGALLEIRPYVWTGSFSDARNKALAEAAKMGADWALTIDTDERLLDGYAITLLDNQSPDVLLCYDEAHTYAKERVICLPLKPGAGWVGPTHECFLAGDGAKTAVFDSWRIRELPKTPEQLIAKFQRDRGVLEKYCMEHRQDSRWWFYLAETYRNLGDTKMASETYKLCSQLSTWDEESAWASYCIAKIDALEGQYISARHYCVGALLAHPGFAEAAALTAWCESKCGNHKAAIYWCGIAQTIQVAEKTHTKLERIGFRDLQVWDWVANLEAWSWDQLNAT